MKYNNTQVLIPSKQTRDITFWFYTYAFNRGSVGITPEKFNPARRSGERCKLPQWVRAEPGRWTFAACWVEKGFWWEQFHVHIHECNTFVLMSPEQEEAIACSCLILATPMLMAQTASSADLIVPATRRSTMDDRAFTVAGPRAWSGGRNLSQFIACCHQAFFILRYDTACTARRPSVDPWTCSQ